MQNTTKLRKELIHAYHSRNGASTSQYNIRNL